MANDNNELKNNASCEEKQDMRELTPDELAKVNGGAVRRVDAPGGAGHRGIVE